MPTSRASSSKSLHQRVESLLATPGPDLTAIPAEDIKALIRDMQVHQMELELQNEGLLQTQQDLALDRDRYAELYDSAPVGYLTLNAVGKVLEANLTACGMLGAKRSIVMGSRFRKYVAPGSQDGWRQNLSQMIDEEAGERQAVVVQLRNPEAEPAWVKLETLRFIDQQSGETRFRSALVDVSEARRISLQLQDSERRFRRLTEAVTDYVYRVRVEDGMGVETVHEVGCETVLGYSPEEFTANPSLWIEMVPEIDRAAVERQVAQVLSGQLASPVETRIRRKDGELRWVQSVVSPQYNERDELVAYDGLLRDITLRKLAQQVVLDQNVELEDRVQQRTFELERRVEEVALLAMAVANMEEGVLITVEDLEWPGPQIVFVNDAMCRITGYTADELVGQTPRILQGALTNRDTLELLRQTLSAGSPFHGELVNYRKDGEPFDAEVFISPLFDLEGHRTNFVSVHRDVTERKLAEEALHREHSLSEGIIEAAQNIILLLDPQGRIVRYNAYMEELSGWKLNEVKGRDWFDTFLPESERDQIRTLFHQGLNGHRTRGNVNPILTREGQEREIEWSDSLLTDAKGNVIGLVCIGQDVTYRNRAEKNLRDSEEKKRAILNTAADAIITIDNRGQITDVNRATERMFGYTRDELIGQNVRILMPSPYREAHDQYLEHYRDTKEARIIDTGREVEAQRKDGSVFPIDLTVSEVDHLNLFTGIIRDVSERKALEREVAEAAEEEKQRISQDLHDSQGALLTAISCRATALTRRLDNMRLTPEAHESEGITRQLREAIQQARTLARGLQPAGNKPHEFIDAFRRLAERTRLSRQVQCRLLAPKEPVAPDDIVTANQLFRIAEEAVQNALRHSGGSHITIQVKGEDDQISLSVTDNGRGFNRGEFGSDGLGLRIMNYRARSIGAGLSIQPRRGGGTRVVCHWNKRR